MKVKILKEEGHEMALRGMAYSYKDRATDPEEWWIGQIAKAEKRAPLLAPKEGGHNKFLESIVVWIDVEASRAWWSEADTYRVGITKQSESTMHTLNKRPPTVDDFEEGTSPRVIDTFISEWAEYKGDINKLKMNLPEGFLQRRLICTNYKTIKNIVFQRKKHRLKWWPVFTQEILNQLEHPEYIQGDEQ